MSIKLMMEVKSIGERLAALEKRTLGAVEGAVHTPLTDLGAELSSVRESLTKLADAIDERITELEGRMEGRIQAIEAKLRIGPKAA